nr:alpha/beta-type small acid-soluble spore protein [Herbinix hemicellulosilytica]
MLQVHVNNTLSYQDKIGGVYMARRNRVEIPEAREALERFKFEVANEIGVPLKKGYNGDLTSYQNGSVGGYMVKKMIQDAEKRMAGQQ